MCAGGGGGSRGDVVASSKGNVNGESRGGGGHLEGIWKRGVTAVERGAGRDGGDDGRVMNGRTCFFYSWQNGWMGLVMQK